MPTVPVIQDSAQLDTNGGRQRVQATPDAFGSQEARATGAVAQGIDKIAQVAVEIDDDFNEAEALELDNELSRRMRDRLYNPESGYLSTQRGRNAVDGRGQVEADIDFMVNEIAGTARNERSAAMFRSVGGRRAASAYGDVATYASQQSRIYQNEQSEGRINESLDNAVAAYSDPAVVQANMSTAVGEVERIAQREGWSPEATQSRIRRIQSDMASRVIVSLAATDPEAAQEMYQRMLPALGAQEAGELLTTMRAAQREAEEGAVDEAWTFVAGGQRIPPEVWARVPGRSRIDIQNEQRRRAEGGAGGGNRVLVEDLRVEAIANPERFATYDLRAVRGQLGSSYDELAVAQARIRNGDPESTDVTQVRTTFNALRDVAESALGVDLSPTESATDRERRRGAAFEAALLREVQQFQAANPGAPINNDVANTLIGRAWVGMRGEGVSRQEGRVEGNGSRRRSAPTEVVVPYRAIPSNMALRLGARLQRRLGHQATEGQVEGAYAALLAADPQTPEEVDAILDRVVRASGDR